MPICRVITHLKTTSISNNLLQYPYKTASLHPIFELLYGLQSGVDPKYFAGKVSDFWFRKHGHHITGLMKRDPHYQPQIPLHTFWDFD